MGTGVVHVKLIGDLPAGSGALEEARRAAGYLAKCVSKNIADERVPRLHGYEMAGLPAGTRVAIGRVGPGRDRAGLGADGRPALARVALVGTGGLARRAGVLGVPGLDDELSERAEKWAEETAVAQGLPPRIEDLDVLRDVCELLGLRRSGAPDGPQA